MTARQQNVIWMKTGAFIVGYLFCNWLVHLALASRLKDRQALSWAFSFSITQGAVITTLLILLIALRLVSQIQQRRQQGLYKLIREPLAAHAMGKDHLARLTQLYSQHPHEVEECLVQFLPSITGDGRERLYKLADSLGLTADWKKSLKSRNVKVRRRAIGWLSQVVQFVSEEHFIDALDDVDETVRLRASRALAKIDDPVKLPIVFAQATTQPLLARALLVEDLRPRAMNLAHHVIPESLASPDLRVVSGTLDAIIAWGKALPLQMPGQLLHHPVSEIRLKALQGLPLMAGQANIQDEIFDALEHGDHSLRAVAARVASRLKMTQALPLLVRCLREPDFETAHSAAFALVALGPNGLAALQKEFLSPNRHSGSHTAAIAFEAYERATIKRLDY